MEFIGFLSCFGQRISEAWPTGLRYGSVVGWLDLPGRGGERCREDLVDLVRHGTVEVAEKTLEGLCCKVDAVFMTKFCGSAFAGKETNLD